MLLPLKDMAGMQVGELEVSDAIFAAPVNRPLMHQALMRQLANARQGNHSTKTRGEVRGGGQKPWRQKGTGRARQGSRRSPNWVGGGTVFGPRPRKYTKTMPRKMRRAALCSALSVKTAGEQVVVIDRLHLDSPKTKTMLSTLESLGANGQSVLIVLAEKDENVQRSAKNLPMVKTLLRDYLNIRDLLGYDMIVLSRDAAEQIELWLGSEIIDIEETVTETVMEEVVVASTPDGDLVVDDVIVDETVTDEAIYVETADGEVVAAAETTTEEIVVAEVEASLDEASLDEISSVESDSSQESEETKE